MVKSKSPKTPPKKKVATRVVSTPPPPPPPAIPTPIVTTPSTSTSTSTPKPTPGSDSELDYWRFTRENFYKNQDEEVQEEYAVPPTPDTSGLWEYAPEFVPLSRFDPRFNEIANAFHEGWIHQHKRADIIAIYHVMEDAFRMWHHGQKFDRYLKSAYGWTRPKLKFHGTTRACTFGNPGSPLEPCWSEGCHFCCILYRGFRLEYAKFGGMFGQGIYSSDASSSTFLLAAFPHPHSFCVISNWKPRKPEIEADHYVKNLLWPLATAAPRAIFVCRVVCDRPQRIVGPDYRRREPDPGFNCVEALTKKDGGSVKYPETIVYREDAIAPVAVVVYEKQYIKGAKESP